MFRKIRKRMLFNKILKFKMIQVSRYNLILKTKDGKIHHVGENYNYTTLSVGDWMEQVMDCAFLTNDSCFVSKSDVVSIQLEDSDNAIFRYTEKGEIPEYFSENQILEQKRKYKEYIKQLTLM